MGLHIIPSNVENAENRHKLWTSSDLLLFDSKGSIVGNGITKGTANGTGGARQIIEQLYIDGKRFVMFIDYVESLEGGTGKIFVGTLGANDVDISIVKSQLHYDMFYQSLFHHETWKKMYSLYQNFGISSMILNWKVLEKVEIDVIKNPKNKYGLEILNRWNEFIFKLVNNFGFDTLSNGIEKVDYDQWWISEVKRSLIWLS
ncbi:MAG: hypothetical protein ACFFFH_09375 [Candidatus Thorarchaeota archaeon]